MASPTVEPFLFQSAAYLGAAAVAVPIFRRLKLGSILGYLAAGVVLGPWGFGLLKVEEGTFHVAEFGVVLFLFVIGLELSPARLWSMRKDIFGLGASQMALVGAVIAACLFWAGFNSGAAIFGGLALALSSTAFALQLLQERGELNAPHGRTSFSVLLFQDLAVIPILALMPIYGAVGGVEGDAMSNAVAMGKAAAVVGVLIVVGRFALNPAFALVAGSGSREAFAAAALFVVAATALSVSAAGLSMALGAFLAGVLLAESSYRHQIETDIEPFRGLLLGLFFIGVGMRLDLGLVAAAWPLVVGGAVLLVALKTGLIFLVARAFGSDRRSALSTGAILSQAGEFAFVILSLGGAEGVFDDRQATILSAITTLSMAMTPPLVALLARLGRNTAEDGSDLEEPHEIQSQAIVVGFGRVGQMVSLILGNSGISVTALDRNPERIRMAERFGFKVFYGDGSRLDLLMTSGAVKADLVVLVMNDDEAVTRAAERLRASYPKLTILTRARDRYHELALMDAEPDGIVRETLESAIKISSLGLKAVGRDAEEVADILEEFRRRDTERLNLQRDTGANSEPIDIHAPFLAAQRRRAKEQAQKTSAA